MGRGGGAHGGGGHSGGRSFGGRGGGFGGSHGGGSFGGPGFGGPGFGGPPPGRPPRWGFGFGPVFPGPGRYRGGPPGRGGCSGILFAIILIIVLVSVFVPDRNDTGQNTEIAVSRTERTAVTGTTAYPEWYLDEPGFIDHDTDLTDGLKYFYSQTGIQPYVMLLDYDPAIWPDGEWSEDAAEQYLAQVYKDTFSDNGHLIFAYFSCENDSESMDGTFYFYYGSAAYSIMDNEAETIFWSYFDMNYNNLDLSIAEFLGQTFRETADNIMHVDTDSSTSLIRSAAIFAVICVAVIIVVIIIVRKLWKKDKI